MGDNKVLEELLERRIKENREHLGALTEAYEFSKKTYLDNINEAYKQLAELDSEKITESDTE